MFDTTKSPTTEESNEFEDVETNQPIQQPQQTLDPQAQAQPQQPAQKPQETFNLKDEMGNILETAAQAFTASSDPAQNQQQQMNEAKSKAEDQKKLANVKQFLNQMAEDEQRYKQKKHEEEQKKQETLQVEEQKKQEEQVKKQDKEQSFQEEHIKAEQTKAERKLGVGG